MEHTEKLIILKRNIIFKAKKSPKAAKARHQIICTDSDNGYAHSKIPYYRKVTANVCNFL
jgi:hypothetical protein